MKHKNVIIPILSIVLTVSMSVSILSFATKLCEREYSRYTYGDYFRKEQSCDVLFLGSSRVINGVFPMQLWKDYGIASFNFGAHANQLPSTYWLMENALRNRQPKLVVVDAYGLDSNYKYSTPEYLHSWMDMFKCNPTKIRAVLDLNNDEYKNLAIASGDADESTKGSSYEFLWDFCKYHSRWNKLYDINFVTPRSTERGAEARINVAYNPDGKNDNEADKNAVLGEPSVGEVYLRRLIEDCNNRDIAVMLTYLPANVSDANYAQANRAAEIAEEYGIGYIDFMHSDTVDYTIDFYDGEHLNPVGAHKVTDVLGQYIRNNYEIPDIRTYSENVLWEEDYQSYVNYKTTLFEANDMLDNCIMMLNDADYDAIIEIRNNNLIAEESTVRLLEELGFNNTDYDIAKMCSEHESVFVVIHEGGKSSEVFTELPNEYMDLITNSENEENIENYSVRITQINRYTLDTKQKEF